MPQKKLLYEVSIIRPFVIFLLVVLHCFCIYTGAWERPEGIGDVPAYYWLSQLIKGFRIETIALIAGYVFAFQSIDLGRKYEFRGFIWKKFKRLIIPCVFFSIIYYFIFYFDKDTFSFVPFIINILSGSGHLWFLPMLFWCFVAIWVIDHFNLSSSWLLILLALVSIIPVPDIPFGFQRLPHFLFYCYLGYTLYEHKQQVLDKWMNTKGISLLWGAYIVLTILNELFLAPQLQFSTETLYVKLGWLLISGTAHLLISISGIVALYLTANMLLTKTPISSDSWIVKASDVCYGVYVYHQFILHGLYDYTPLPLWAGTYWLPWVAIVITLLISYMLTQLTLLTKTGRFLIG